MREQESTGEEVRMEYTEEHLPDGRDRVIIEFHHLDFVGIRLDPWDRFLFDECKKSEKVSDKLLGLERIARLIEEQT